MSVAEGNHMPVDVSRPRSLKIESSMFAGHARVLLDDEELVGVRKLVLTLDAARIPHLVIDLDVLEYDISLDGVAVDVNKATPSPLHVTDEVIRDTPA